MADLTICWEISKILACYCFFYAWNQRNKNIWIFKESYKAELAFPAEEQVRARTKSRVHQLGASSSKTLCAIQLCRFAWTTRQSILEFIKMPQGSEQGRWRSMNLRMLYTHTSYSSFCSISVPNKFWKTEVPCVHHFRFQWTLLWLLLVQTALSEPPQHLLFSCEGLIQMKGRHLASGHLHTVTQS